MKARRPGALSRDPGRGSPGFAARAQLFAQLALMEHAGLPVAAALGTLRVSGVFRARIAAMQQLVAKGVDLASAGERSDVFTPLETELVRAAIQGGSPEPIFRRLAADYERRAAQRASMRSKLVMPAALFTLAVFLQPLPDLVLSRIGPAGYLARALLPLAVAGALLWALATPRLSAARAALAAHLPLFGPMHERRNLRDLFQSLALLLEAGLPAASGFPLALCTVADPVIAARFAPVTPLLARGAALTSALESVPFLEQSDAIGFVRTGEASGTLPMMLQRVADRLTEAINRFDSLVVALVPRLFYLGVAIWMVMHIMGDMLALPKIPADL